jgi:hypothetical protein
MDVRQCPTWSHMVWPLWGPRLLQPLVLLTNVWHTLAPLYLLWSSPCPSLLSFRSWVRLAMYVLMLEGGVGEGGPNNVYICK